MLPLLPDVIKSSKGASLGLFLITVMSCFLTKTSSALEIPLSGITILVFLSKSAGSVPAIDLVILIFLKHHLAENLKQFDNQKNLELPKKTLPTLD